MSLDILKRKQEEKLAEVERLNEGKRLEMEQSKQLRLNYKKAFEDALDYGISILDGAEVKYKVSDLLDESIELIADILGDEKAIQVMEKHDFIFELSVKTPTGEPIEKVFTFKKEDLRTGAEIVINEIAAIIKEDYSKNVLDTINLSGKRVLKVTEDIHFGDFVKRESVGLDFTAEEIEALSPFKVREFDKVNYADTEREITYRYNVVADPLGNEIMVFLIATADGMVAKLKKGTFGLINHKNLSAIEFKLLKKVVDVLLAADIEIALEGKKAKDLGIWDEVDASTITNAGRLEKQAEYAELKVEEEAEVTELQVEAEAEVTDFVDDEFVDDEFDF